jgi:hypothetical protein
MGRSREPSRKELEDWDEWVASRAGLPLLQAAASKFFPWDVYRYKATGHIGVVVGYTDKGLVTLYVPGRYNHVMYEFRIVSVDPHVDLEPCDPPGQDERVGCRVGQLGGGISDLHGGEVLTAPAHLHFYYPELCLMRPTPL